MDYETLFATKMDEILIEEMKRTNTAGTAVGIVEESEFYFHRTYGARDFEQSHPVTTTTLFCIASVTKSFICAGILKLQEMGKLSIQDPISLYLPMTVGYKDNPITIHHMMTHQSGIPNLGDSMWSRNREASLGLSYPIPKYPFTTWKDGFRYLNQAQEYIAPPGERFHYNNFGYGILSKLITEVSGTPYKEFLRKNIFEPLDMKRTGFYNSIIEDTNLAKAYMDKPDSSVDEFVHVPYSDIRLTRSLDEAAGGLFSSVEELSHYMIMQLNHGIYDGVEVLTKESVYEMQQAHFTESYPNSAFTAFYGQNKSGYGYGFAIDDDFHGHKLVQHSGSFIGASAWFAFLPEHDRGVIMLSNHHPSPRIFAQAILIESLGKDIENDWPLMKLRKLHEKLTGEYHTYKGMSKIKIKSDGTRLIMTNINDENPTFLIPMDNNPFTTDYYLPSSMGGKDPAQFFSDNDGEWLHIERNKWKKVKD